MIELIIAGIFCVIIGVLVKMNLDLQEKVNQLEFDKIMRGINSDLETKGEDHLKILLKELKKDFPQSQVVS
jgi:hypothetical protein